MSHWNCYSKLLLLKNIDKKDLAIRIEKAVFAVDGALERDRTHKEERNSLIDKVANSNSQEDFFHNIAELGIHINPHAAIEASILLVDECCAEFNKII